MQEINNYKTHREQLFNMLSFQFLEICVNKNLIKYNLNNNNDYIFNYQLFKLVNMNLKDYSIVKHRLNINSFCDKGVFEEVFNYICETSMFKTYLIKE